MFERIIVYPQRSLSTAGPIDMGLLAEAFLLYGSVEVPLNDATLKQLIVELGTDGLFEFVDRGWLQLSHHSAFAGISTTNAGTATELHTANTFTIHRKADNGPIGL